MRTILYMYIYFKQNSLPQSVADAIHLFSSQPCENIFRDARSLSGIYSTGINFTMMQFLKRIDRLNACTNLNSWN